MTFTTSVVICAYTHQRWHQLVSAVASVRSQTRPVDEIVVVIDHDDELLERAQGALPDVAVIPNAGPRGLSGGRNTGIAHTTGDIVIFLDDDATADPDWTQHLLAGYVDRDVLGVGGAAQPRWQEPAPGWWPSEFGWVIGCSYRGQPTQIAAVRNLMGCNMSVRRTVLEAVGGFDAALGRTADRPLGCEETELCIRAADLFPRGRFLHEPRALVHHFVPVERSSWGYFRRRCVAEGVSKAWVQARVGRTQALSSERDYVSRVLPSGAARHISSAVHGDPSGVLRAAALLAGLTCTSFGYLRTRLLRGPKRPTAPDADPVIPLVVDLREPMVGIDPRRSGAPPYRSALCLVTDGGDPVGKVRLELGAEPVAGPDVAARLRGHLGLDQNRRMPTGPVASVPVSVVIATRDRPRLLSECLASVFAGSLGPREVIVVDNAPSDRRTAEVVATWAETEPRLRYVREDRAGLARAHNAALPFVTSPIVAFTDDDVVVDRRWLERMASAFGDDQQIACVTGLIAPRELETLAQQWIEGNTTYDKGLSRRTFDAGPNRPADPLFPYTAGVFGSGANMGFRTSYLRRRGGFDVALGTGTYAMGGDDLAAFYDVVTSGRRLVYEPAAIVLHRHYRHYAGLRRQTYGYGAGLGAHLTRCLLREPRLALVLVRHAVTAGKRAAKILAPTPLTDLPPYPAELSRTHLSGLVSGPWRYLISRRRVQVEEVA